MTPLQRLLSLLVLLACSLASAAGALPAPEPGKLNVYFLDVGQGDASLIVAPSGKTVLVDGGPPESARSLVEKLSSVLKGPLDLVVLTHPHLDHLGGLERVLSRFGAKRFMDPGFDHPSTPYRKLLDAVGARGVTYVEPRLDPGGQPMTIGLGDGASLTVLWPRRPSEPFLTGTRSDPNANSIVFRLTYGENSVLFTGDSEADTESRLLRSGQNLRAQVLKVAHHGSRFSNNAPFLQRVSPTSAVISCGTHNDYGHPHGAAVKRLEAVGARVFRTDLQGDILAVGDGRKLTVGAVASVAAQAAGPAPAPAPPTDVEYAASRRSSVFHRADCRAVRDIKPDNLVRFTDRKEAAKGRRPAGDCKP